MFIAAVFGFTRLQQQFFPQSSRPELSVDIKLPDGSSFIATADMVRRIEELLKPEMVATDGAQQPTHADGADSNAADAKPAGFQWSALLGHGHEDANKPDVEYFTSYTGAGSARFFLALNPDLPNPSFAKIDQ